ncbi:MAG: YceH family protein [Deltaproteobacteria bacterium]|nr:YceH family protein [Deltaproteobacteria bacterium]
MEEPLNDREARVLGSLMEKEMATPEYYPLSLNALVNACNQKSNREPVVNYDEATVLGAISSLKEKRFALQTDASRVSKFAENFVKLHNLLEKEAALICLLLLRGAQTPGELRGRSERLYQFRDLAEVEAKLEDLCDMGMVTKLPRQPGRKESRYMQLLAGPPEPRDLAPGEPLPSPRPTDVDHDRITALEEKVHLLQQELHDLQTVFLQFKKQFE